MCLPIPTTRQFARDLRNENKEIRHERSVAKMYRVFIINFNYTFIYVSDLLLC